MHQATYMYLKYEQVLNMFFLCILGSNDIRNMGSM